MSIIHMEIETARDLYNKMKVSSAILQNSWELLDWDCRVADWSGRARDEFIGNINELKNQFNTTIDQYQALQMLLDTEIRQWEEAAQRLDAGRVGIDFPIPPKPLTPAEIRQKNRDYFRSRWGKLSDKEKIDALNRYQESIANEYGIDPIKIKLKDIKDKGGDIVAYYRKRGNQIVIDKDNLASDSPFDMLDTVAHETRHQIQHYFVDHPDEAPSSITKEQLEAWDKNFDNYISGNDNFEKYRKQPVEADARDFARKEVNDYFGSSNGNELLPEQPTSGSW